MMPFYTCIHAIVATEDATKGENRHEEKNQAKRKSTPIICTDTYNQIKPSSKSIKDDANSSRCSLSFTYYFAE